MKIESAQHLWAIRTALEAFADQRVPFGIMLKLRRWRNRVNEIQDALTQDLKPYLPEGGGIGPGDDEWPAFVKAAEESFEPTPIDDLSPLKLDELKALQDRPDFALSTSLFEVLFFAGIVTE